MTDLSEESAFRAGRDASAVWPRPVTVKWLSSFRPGGQERPGLAEAAGLLGRFRLTRLRGCWREKDWFRSSRLAGLIRPIQRELLGGARKHVHKLREGRASWPLGGSASAKAGPKSSESEAAVCRISSSPKETVSRALGLGNRKSCKNSTGEFARTRPGEGGREKARPVCSLSISSSSTSEPQVAASREAAISRGAAEVLDARQ